MWASFVEGDSHVRRIEYIKPVCTYILRLLVQDSREKESKEQFDLKSLLLLTQLFKSHGHGDIFFLAVFMGIFSLYSPPSPTCFFPAGLLLSFFKRSYHSSRHWGNIRLPIWPLKKVNLYDNCRFWLRPTQFWRLFQCRDDLHKKESGKFNLLWECY